MSRMRMVKPEFCVSEQLAECSPNARLTFVLMWMFCDDQGIHPAKPRALKGEIFPLDEGITAKQVEAWVGELIAVGLLREYEVGSDVYWIVTGWSKHQRIDKPSKKHPPPLAESSPKPPRILAEPSPPEGKGMERKELTQPPVQAAPQVSDTPAVSPTVALAAAGLSAGALSAICISKGVTSTPSHPDVQQWAAEGITREQLEHAIGIARTRKPFPARIPVGYVNTVLRDPANKLFDPEAVFAEAMRLTAEREARDAAH